MRRFKKTHSGFNIESRLFLGLGPVSASAEGDFFVNERITSVVPGALLDVTVPQKE